MGLLRVTGTIDIAQFWPDGSSDADTSTVLVDISKSAFKFQEHEGAPFKITRLFDNASVRGQGTKLAVKNGKITVRLQGIDAPELHYRPVAPRAYSAAQKAAFKKYNDNFRQTLGETAAAALGKMLGGTGTFKCVVLSYVDKPNDVFDTYGRFVGEIVVTRAGKNTNINHWVLEKGWGFGTFYNSMVEGELDPMIKLVAKARKAKAGIYAYESNGPINSINFNLIHRKAAPPGWKPLSDAGPVVMPKTFRRQSVWSVGKKAKTETGNFRAYLQKTPDSCFEMDDFVSQGSAAKHRLLSEFFDGSSKFKSRPEDLVFVDKPSTLVDKNGKKITHW